jgi:hypothetical protein
VAAASATLGEGGRPLSLCAVRQLDLGRCACFKALTDDMGRDGVREALRDLRPPAA